MPKMTQAELRAERTARLNRETRELIEQHRYWPEAGCWLCPERDLTTLEWLDQSFIEQHHAAGGRHDRQLKWPVCANCHKRLHSALRDRRVPLTRQQSIFETVIAVLEALAVFFDVLVQSLRRFAIQSHEAIERLDQAHAGWRSVVGGAT